MKTTYPNTCTVTYRLSAAQCNAQRELAPAQLVQHIIEVATEHADQLDVGFKRLQQDGNLWVLSRISFEVKRYPRLLEEFSLTTWIESYNRHFSERNFELKGDNDEVLGYARTIWVAINAESRRPADLSGIAHIASTVSDKPCPMTRPTRIRPVDPPQIVHNYQFVVSDIDFNRHVNSARYVDLVLNQINLPTYDQFFLSRFEIEYKHEAHFGDEVDVCSTFTDSDTMVSSIEFSDTEQPICCSRLKLSPRP